MKEESFVQNIHDVGEDHLIDFVVPDSPGPGFLIDGRKNLCRFDIVQPQCNFTTRLKLDYVDFDENKLISIKKNAEVLKDFFNGIELMKTDGGLELNVLKNPLPDGYVLMIL